MTRRIRLPKRHEVLRLLQEHGGIAGAARALGCHTSSLAKGMTRLGIHRRPADRLRAMSDDEVSRLMLQSGTIHGFMRLARVGHRVATAELERRDLHFPRGSPASDLDDEALCRVIQNCGMSMVKAASALGVARVTLIRHGKQRGLFVPKGNDRLRVRLGGRLVRTSRKRAAQRAFKLAGVEIAPTMESNTMATAAKILGVSHTTLRREADRRGMPRRRAW